MVFDQWTSCQPPPRLDPVGGSVSFYDTTVCLMKEA